MRNSRATVGAENPVRRAISRTWRVAAECVNNKPITASRVRPSSTAPKLAVCKSMAYKCKLLYYKVKAR